MRLPHASDTMAALLMGALTWAAWPAWSEAAGSAFATLPAAWVLLLSLVAFRVLLTPLRAALSWLLAATARHVPPQRHRASRNE